MLVVGAKGLAKEILEILHQNNLQENVVFYDDVNMDIGSSLYDKFPILKSADEAKIFFASKTKEFTIGIGNPKLRYKLYNIFRELGGTLVSTISPKSDIGNYGNSIGEGCNITSGVVITNDVHLGKGCLINLNVTVGHDCHIGDFVELCPNVNISGNCTIGNFTFIGTSATVLPNIKIGNNVIIGAGAVVTKYVPDNSMAIGVPAKIVKNLEPLNF